jgi:hypothetical protein
VRAIDAQFLDRWRIGNFILVREKRWVVPPHLAVPTGFRYPKSPYHQRKVPPSPQSGLEIATQMLHMKKSMRPASACEKFGKLIVLKEEVILKGGKNRIFSTCECECGGKKVCERYGLMLGSTTSCGCIRRETTIAFNKTKKKPKGQLKKDDRRYKMFHNAQHRAKRKGIPFSITIDDIIIPDIDIESTINTNMNYMYI